MSIPARLRSWLRSVTRRSRMESEMDAELLFHLESYTEDLIKTGVAPGEARRRARVEFGGVETQKEECRESLGLRLWDELRADLRFGFRMLRQDPGFTAVAVLSLALGIGANAAIFTMAREVLLTTMAVPHADDLRMLYWIKTPKTKIGAAWGNFWKDKSGRSAGAPFSYAIYQEMRKQNQVFDDLVAFKDVHRITATIGGEPEPVDADLVSGNFYQSMGVKTIAGRPIEPSDGAVAVISDAYWARRFGRSASVLGSNIALNRFSVTIIGVNPPQFKGVKAGATPEIFLPITLQPDVVPNPQGSLLANNNFWWVMMMGRLKPGVSDKAALASMSLTFRQAVLATIPGKPEAEFAELGLRTGNRGLDQLSEQFAKPTYILMIAAGLVLLIACVNLANMLLARSAARQREMSVRLALGAGRLRVIRQVLTESLLLAALGGAAGLVFGYAGRNIIPSLFEASWRTNSIQTGFDWRVFVFALALTVATGLLFGVAPAWRSTHADVNSGLLETGRMTAGRNKTLLGKSLVVVQVSLSVILLIGAGLFLRTLANLKTTSIGFNPERILLFDVKLPRSRYSAAQRVDVFRQIEERANSLPGVQSATLSSEPLLANSASNDCFRPTGRPPHTGDQDYPWLNNVGSRFFETIAIPIVYGRGFSLHDNARGPKVAILNQRLAASFFPNTNPVGKTLSACDPNSPPTVYQIVGVSANAKYYDMREDPPPTLYLPYAQSDDVDSMTFEVKTAASAESITSEVRQAIRSIDRDLPLLDVRTQIQQIDATLSQERVFATLTGGFGLLALVLASVGIYGIMSYGVARRINEIGIRMALGARAAAVLGMILREAFWLACLGVAVGVAAAVGVTRFVASMLFGLKPTDPLTIGSAAILLLGIALIAGFTPAFRASRVDPMQALRHD